MSGRTSVGERKRKFILSIPQAVGDELHCVFDSPHFSDIRAQFPGLFQDAAGVHAYIHVAQGPEVCLPLSRCLAAEGSDMNTIPSS